MQKVVNSVLVTDPTFPSYNLGNVYHHSYGLLFPAVHYIQQLGLTDQSIVSREEYLNTFTTEFLSLLGLKINAIYSPDEPTPPEHKNLIILPRWDYHLLALSSSKYQPEFYAKFVAGFIPRFPNIRLFAELENDQTSIEIPLQEALTSLRDQVISSLDLEKDNLYQDKILLIDRSPVSTSIHRSEFFKWRGYGKHSRNIMNMDEIEEELKKHGVPVIRFTPGIESVFTQIQAFASCSGVISLRGAELMHTLWMKKRSKLVVIETRDIMEGCSYNKIMSEWFDHDYNEIEIRQGRFIHLNPIDVLKFF